MSVKVHNLKSIVLCHEIERNGKGKLVGSGRDEGTEIVPVYNQCVQNFMLCQQQGAVRLCFPRIIVLEISLLFNNGFYGRF